MAPPLPLVEALPTVEPYRAASVLEVEDVDLSAAGVRRADFRTPSPGPSAPSRPPSRWKCVTPQTKTNPRSRQCLGHASLRGRPASESSTRPPSRSCNSSAFTPRSGSACEDDASYLHWRQPPRYFRDQQDADAQRGCTGPDKAAGSRAWSTEPIGSSVLSSSLHGRRAPKIPGQHSNLPGGGRAATALGVWSEHAVLERETPEPQGRRRAESACAEDISEQRSSQAYDMVPKSARSNEGRGYAGEETYARLATPKVHGESDSTKWRNLGRSYDAFAREAASGLVPDAAAPQYDGSSFSDTWRTAGEDGYKSAMFHAAVRCQELRQGTGLEPADFVPSIVELPSGSQGLVFQGQKITSDSVLCRPELVRLHTACLLFSQLCTVPSPMQDTLCFLLRELCQCLFEGFCPGTDVLLLTPFFVTAIQARADVEAERRRADLLQQERDELRSRFDELQLKVERNNEKNRRAQDLADKHQGDLQSLETERNELKAAVARLQQVGEIRSDELRELGKEFDLIQGQAYTTRRELEQAKKAEFTMASASKEHKRLIHELEGRTSDLELALQLATEALASKKLKLDEAKEEAREQIGLTPELEEELMLRLRNETASSESGGSKSLRAEKQSDKERVLKMPLPDGGHQMIMKSSIPDGGDQFSLCTYMGKRGSGPALIVSGEAFAALSIGAALPRPPNPLHYKGKDDEDVLSEVRRGVSSLSLEHHTLILMARQLRKELKDVEKLIPDWNRDELRGLLKSVLVLDPDEAFLVPSPTVGQSTLMGLGEGDEIPDYLKFVGLLKLKPMEHTDTLNTCYGIWYMKTMRDLDLLRDGSETSGFPAFLEDMYIPNISSKRLVQMEHLYNFLLSLRGCTTLGKSDEINQSGSDIQPTLASATSSKGTKAKHGSHRNAADDSKNGSKHDDTPETNESATPQSAKRLKGVPEVNFHGSSEILYRTLLGELHEDLHHDQTAMLVAFAYALASFSERLCPSHWIPPSGTAREIEPAVIGLAEFSAIMRLFFPGKPREHLSCLKQMILKEVQGEEKDVHYDSDDELTNLAALTTDSTTGKIKKRGARKRMGSVQTSETDARRGAVKDRVAAGKDLLTFRKPLNVDLGQLLGVRFWRGQVVHPENLLEDLLTEPSPFVVELRRQHLVESFMFLERLQKNLRVAAPYGGPVAESGAPLVTSKQADKALSQADHGLTMDQRNLYVLRGFGCRLPDPPSSGQEVAAEPSVSSSPTRAQQASSEALIYSPMESTGSIDRGYSLKRAGVFYKTRRMLGDHIARLTQDADTVATDVFVQRLMAAGVTKTAGMWHPEVSVKDIVREAGHEIVRPTTATAPLLEFVGCTAGSGSNTGDEPRSHVRIEQEESRMSDDAEEVVDKYYAHAVAGKDLQELSIGYTELVLLHWLACPH